MSVNPAAPGRLHGPGADFDPTATSFGVPGAALKASGLPAEQVAAGIAGEERVARVLDEFAARTPGARVFHSLMLSDRSDMDHVVVVGRTIILVDSKNWAGGHTYRIGADGKHVTRDGGAFAGGSTSMGYFLHQWAAEFRGWAVLGIVCVARDDVQVDAGAPGFGFVKLGGLPAKLASIARASSTKPLSRGDVLRFARLAVDPNGARTTEVRFALLKRIALCLLPAAVACAIVPQPVTYPAVAVGLIGGAVLFWRERRAR